MVIRPSGRTPPHIPSKIHVVAHQVRGPKVYRAPICPIAITISIISIQSRLSSIIQEENLLPSRGGMLPFFFYARPTRQFPYVSHTSRSEYGAVLSNWAMRGA